MESTKGYTFILPPVWELLLPLAWTPDRRDRRLLGVSSEIHWQSGVNGIAKVSKWHQCDPGRFSFCRCSDVCSVGVVMCVL